MSETPGLTVHESKVKKFTKLVKEGKKPGTAAKLAGISLSDLRRPGAITAAARELLARVREENLLEKKTLKALAESRGVELMLQDENLKVAQAATRMFLTGGPQIAVQINNNLIKDPEVLESLKTLQLEVDDDDGTE